MNLKKTLFTVTALGALTLSAHAQMGVAPTTATPMIPGMMPGTTPGFVTSADTVMPMPPVSPMPNGTMPATAMPMPDQMSPMGMMVAQDTLFVARAAEGNLAEIALAKLALNKSKNDNVRQTAQVILMGHTKAQNDLMGIMRAVNLPNMPMISAPHMAVYNALSKTSGAEFDRMYMAGQTADHENTIALFASQVNGGSDGPLKGYASQYLPDIVGHTILIYNVAKQIQAPGSELRPQLPPVPPGVTPAFMGAPIDMTNYGTIVASMNATMRNMNQM